MAKSQEMSCGWKYSLDPVDSELVIARTCIAYLMFDVLDGSIAHTSVEQGYLNYASKFWAIHRTQVRNHNLNNLSQTHSVF